MMKIDRLNEFKTAYIYKIYYTIFFFYLNYTFCAELISKSPDRQFVV